jgi:hypothetical protein
MARRFWSSASFGKRQEYVAIAELLRRGFDVYQTLVDDKGIDCIVRHENNGELRYLDIQVKARSKDCSPRNAGRFAGMEVPNPRPNYYFIFYSEHIDAYWEIPSLDLISIASQNKKGKNKGKYSVNLSNLRATGAVVPSPRFDRYKNSFHLIEEALM